MQCRICGRAVLKNNCWRVCTTYACRKKLYQTNQQYRQYRQGIDRNSYHKRKLQLGSHE